jgi:tRNA pseudouridine55 synthase
MDGIILINKDKGFTSQDAISKVKGIINAKKIGHAGTLDPHATGLLVVMVDGATKLSDYLMAAKKEYIAEVIIGKASNTLDSEGEITEIKKVTDVLDIDDALTKFIGKSMQIPPMFSAIKQGGKKLYELARRGIEVERKPREIEIFEIKRVSEIVNEEGFLRFSFRAVVSKGTYIRTLCEDIGKILGYPALMNNLVRTKIGCMSLDDAHSISDIESGNFKYITMLDALKEYPKISVDKNLYKLIINGVPLDKSKVNFDYEMVLFTFEDQLIGIYKKINGKYKAERIWN